MSLIVQVLYLTYGETPIQTGVYQSQVLDLAEEINKSDGVNLKLHSVVPFVNSGFKRMGGGYFREKKKIKENYDIGFDWIIAPQNLIYSSFKYFDFFHMWDRKKLKDYIITNEVKIVHCRSYHAAYEAVKIKKMYGLEYKVIFDPRGHFPEEVCVKGKAKFNDSKYKFLKKIEQYILNHVDIIVCLSDPMFDYFSEKTSTQKCKLIYASAKLPTNNNSAKNINNTDLKTLCYVGAMPDNGWHKASSLQKLYKAFKKSFPTTSTRLLIITQTDPEVILRHFDSDIRGDIDFYNAKGSEDVYNKLLEADFGALPFSDPIDEAEALVGKTMIGTKTLEYIACGIPIIANDLCLGATTLITKYKFGITYNETKVSEDVNFESINNVDIESCKINGPSICEGTFSLSSNSIRYLNLYKDLV